jgi:hypothetical protein
MYPREKMFPVTMTTAFEKAAKSIAQDAVKEAIAKLAARNGFDPEEALAFVMGTGVQIKKETLPRNALPWCGNVIEGDCQGLAYKEGLFTQCTLQAVEGEDETGGKKWCKKCAKQVAEHGTTKNGDVHQRKACGLMAFKAGKRSVISYRDYMERHKITREEAEAAAKKYRLKIDPVQFECKKRGRPTTTLTHMMTPAQELPEAPSEPAAALALPEPSEPAAAAPPQPHRDGLSEGKTLVRRRGPDGYKFFLCSWTAAVSADSWRCPRVARGPGPWIAGRW